jgi:hypothetical protein
VGFRYGNALLTRKRLGVSWGGRFLVGVAWGSVKCRGSSLVSPNADLLVRGRSHGNSGSFIDTCTSEIVT